jgi:hypothetical protein
MAISGLFPAVGSGETVDAALLAFLKCHVSSPAKWDIVRWFSEREGAWLELADVTYMVRRPNAEVAQALAELAHEAVLEADMSMPGETRYRLPHDEPTTVVVRRLVEKSRSSQELRALIAAHLLRTARDAPRAA